MTPTIEARRDQLGAEELLLGRFRIIDRIGSGGMGVVSRAFDERLQRHVAVKELHAAAPQRVLREAQASARLNHPGIVTLYEMGEQGGRAVLVSELVEGGTLADLTVAGGLADRDIAELGAGLCDALEHAHARGVIHRDVKPSNVLVCRDEALGRRAKLLDFGIARVRDAETLTDEGAVVGTLAYMSPEQAAGEGTEAASDVYSLALTLYECWAGANPVAGGSAAEVARRIGERVPGLAEARPDLPSELCERIDAALEADPELRPAPSVLADTLERFAPELHADSPVPLPRSAIWEGSARRRGRGSVAAPLLLAVAVTVLAWPLALPGAAVVLALLGLPVALSIAFVPRVGLAPLAAPLGALGVGIVFAAPAAGLARGFAERAALGGAGVLWSIGGAWLVGGTELTTPGTSAPSGWAADAGATLGSLGDLLLEPLCLGLIALGALAAVALGIVMRTSHLALALIGALIWAAGVEAVLVGLDGTGFELRPATLAAAAGLTVIAQLRSRGRLTGSARRMGAPRGRHGWSGRLA